MAVLRVTLAGALAAGALEGCSQLAGGLPSCGSAPVASGPDTALATITLTAPGEAVSASVIRPQVTIRVAGAVVPKDLGVPAHLDIVRGGKVVGTYRGGVAGTGLVVSDEARSAGGQPVPTEPLLLSGCPSANLDPAAPDATRRPLPAGEYQLVASIEGFEYGRPESLLVSAPSSIRVT